MKLLWITLVNIGLLLGCSQDKPKPETFMNIEVTPIEMLQNQEPAAVVAVNQEVKSQEMYIKHQVKGKNVYIECFIPNFSFKNSSRNGYLSLYIDNKKIKNVTTAAFIVKGLSEGKHLIKLKMTNHPLGDQDIKKEFWVNIK